MYMSIIEHKGSWGIGAYVGIIEHKSVLDMGVSLGCIVCTCEVCRRGELPIDPSMKTARHCVCLTTVVDQLFVSMLGWKISLSYRVQRSMYK